MTTPEWGSGKMNSCIFDEHQECNGCQICCGDCGEVITDGDD